MKIGQNPELPTSLTQQVQAAKQAKAAPGARRRRGHQDRDHGRHHGRHARDVLQRRQGPGPVAAQQRGFRCQQGQGRARGHREGSTFTVDAEAIADKLLSNAQETIAHSPKSH